MDTFEQNSNYIIYIVLTLCVLIIVMMGLWIYKKVNLNTTNCNTMNTLYKDFGLVHSINTDLDDYKYNLRDYYISIII